MTVLVVLIVVALEAFSFCTIPMHEDPYKDYPHGTFFTND